MENLVKFPSHKIVRGQQEPEIIKQINSLKCKTVFDQIADESGMDFIATLSHLGFDIMDKEVQVKVYLLVEMYRAILYDSEDIAHPFHKAIEALSNSLSVTQKEEAEVLPEQ
jgi:hypothetical protein